MDPAHELLKNGERSNRDFLEGADTEELVPLRPGHFPVLGATLHIYQPVDSTLRLDLQMANDQRRIRFGAPLPRVKGTAAAQLLRIYLISAAMAKAMAFHT